MHEIRVAVAQLLIHLHDTPFVEDERLHAGHQSVGSVVTVPAVFAKGLINLDNFSAMFSKFAPEGDVGQDGHIEGELAGSFLVIHFHQGAAKGLVRDLGFAADESVRRNFLNIAGNFAGNAEAAIVFVDAFIERIGHTESVAGFERGRGGCQKSGLDEIVGTEEGEVFSFGSEFQTAIAITEKADVAGITNPLTFDRLKFLNHSFSAVRRAIVEHDDSIGPERLPGNRFESLTDKFLAVINRNNRDYLRLHCDVD